MERNRSSFFSRRLFDAITDNEAETFKGVVVDVILDNDSELVKDGKIGLGKVGWIQFMPMSKKFFSGTKGDLFASPMDKNFNTIPIKNEKVDIIQTASGYFYRRGGENLSPNVDTTDNILDRLFKPKPSQSGGTSKNYQSTANTGIANKNTSSDEKSGYGDVFEQQGNFIHPLRYYEGDSLIQSRFGQSLRFSGYNNAEESLSPTIILRNRENDVSQNDIDTGQVTEEDVNRDGSTIILSSVDYKLDFQPGVIDDGGSSNFKNKPNSFADYPSELIGDQILINSGRVIISSKESEMIFYSKGNYGFISDGALSIDNKGGMLVNVEDDTFFTTNNNNFNITSGTGEIHIGNGSGEEPIVKGDTLVDVLGDLIDAINQMTHPTPAGPSGPPVNAAVFSQIKSRLKIILSSKNFVD